MALVIWDYPLSFVESNKIELELPAGADILEVDMDPRYRSSNQHICLWAMVDTQQDKSRTHTFLLAKNGEKLPIGQHLEHMAVLSPTGSTVQHLFRVG